MLKITNRKGLLITETSGMDCLELCLDKKHFKNYPKEITYQYNSRGFRDREWPEDLSDVIWCVGDSFTVGVGQPAEEAWPQLLEKKTGKRCLNLGEDGCSNDTLALRAKELITVYNPKNLVIMWSYFSRRRISDIDVHYDKKDFGNEKDLKNFAQNFISVDKLKSNIIHLMIPLAFISDKKISEYLICKKFKLLNKEQFDKIIYFEQLDYARDYHHFDIKTSELVCNLIADKLKGFDK